MTSELTRRDLLKAQAAAIAASTAGIALPAAAQSVPGGVQSLEIKWSKAPCRFCGTGCGVMVGVKDNQVVKAGDPLVRIDVRDYDSRVMAAEAAFPSRDGGTGRCTHPSLRHPEFP